MCAAAGAQRHSLVLLGRGGTHCSVGTPAPLPFRRVRGVAAHPCCDLVCAARKPKVEGGCASGPTTSSSFHPSELSCPAHVLIRLVKTVWPREGAWGEGNAQFAKNEITLNVFNFLTGACAGRRIELVYEPRDRDDTSIEQYDVIWRAIMRTESIPSHRGRDVFNSNYSLSYPRITLLLIILTPHTLRHLGPPVRGLRLPGTATGWHAAAQCLNTTLPGCSSNRLDLRWRTGRNEKLMNSLLLTD